ncbi:MAG: phosphodiester glycosidase family protein [Lentisphaerae bacterium]|nr:phosphodiester glycosidase family protein [Lentisphaerota bacterium]
MRRNMKKSFLLCLAVITFAVYGQWWDDGTFDWSGSKELVPGINYCHLQKDSPRLMKIWAMRVNLTRNFTFHTSKKAAEYGKIMESHKQKNYVIHTKRQRTADFMMEHRKKGVNMIAAVNGAPWSPWDGIYSPYATRLGLLVSDGEVVSPVLPGRPSLIIYRDGKIDLKTLTPQTDLKNIAQAITGFGFSLIKDKVQKSGPSLAPRTGYGLSEEREYLYLIVVDGRQPDFSMGCTVQEVGSILKYFGAFDGVNMDGGGSSSFVIYKGGKAVMLNHQPGGGVRAVGASLGIAVNE